MAVLAVAGEGADTVDVLQHGRDPRVAVLCLPRTTADCTAGPAAVLPSARLLSHLLLRPLPTLHIPVGHHLVTASPLVTRQPPYHSFSSFVNGEFRILKVNTVKCELHLPTDRFNVVDVLLTVCEVDSRAFNYFTTRDCFSHSRVVCRTEQVGFEGCT